ncbi:MAG: YdjY domain-containing protein [Limisphaerales bacterium]
MKTSRRPSFRGLVVRAAGSVAAVVLPHALNSPALAADPPPRTSPPVRDGDRIRFGEVSVHPPTRTVSFPASVQMTNGLLEYAVVTEYGKTHESLLMTTALPIDIQAALVLLRAQPTGTNGLRSPIREVPPRSAIGVTVAWTNAETPFRVPLNQLVALTTGGPQGAITGSLRAGPWIFNGSMFTPEGFGAHFDGSIVALIHDPIAILNNPGPDRDDDEIHVPAPGRLPRLGTSATVELVVGGPVGPGQATAPTPHQGGPDHRPGLPGSGAVQEPPP